MHQEQQVDNGSQHPGTRIICTCSYSGWESLRDAMELFNEPESSYTPSAAAFSEPTVCCNASTTTDGQDIWLYVERLGRSEGHSDLASRFDKWISHMAFSSEAGLQVTVLLRDPIQLLDSLRHVEGENARIDVMVECYTAMVGLLDNTRHSNKGIVSCYERLVQEQLEVTRALGAGLTIRSPEEGAAFTYRGLLSNDEKFKLEAALGASYLAHCWGKEAKILSADLLKKTWFAFDLDDTLHEFRRASSNAITSVLELIAERYGVPMIKLKDGYSVILKQSTANAFADGKSSLDYRKERFTYLLTVFNVPVPDEIDMQVYLDLYEKVLTESLELKCGALSLLKRLKEMGKRIAIITEGPQDAQERTIDGLGIKVYVDFLATTNRFRVSKTNGLFPRVLQHMRIEAQDMVYVGDSSERDIIPARAEGILAVHLDESHGVCFDRERVRINTLPKLESVLAMNLLM